MQSIQNTSFQELCLFESFIVPCECSWSRSMSYIFVCLINNKHNKKNRKILVKHIKKFYTHECKYFNFSGNNICIIIMIVIIILIHLIVCVLEVIFPYSFLGLFWCVCMCVWVSECVWVSVCVCVCAFSLYWWLWTMTFLFVHFAHLFIPSAMLIFCLIHFVTVM